MFVSNLFAILLHTKWILKVLLRCFAVALRWVETLRSVLRRGKRQRAQQSSLSPTALAAMLTRLSRAACRSRAALLVRPASALAAAPLPLPAARAAVSSAFAGASHQQQPRRFAHGTPVVAEEAA